MKRIFLFLCVNLVITITLSTITSVLGVSSYMGQSGISYGTLAIWCFVWGTGGSLISLLLSKTIAKWTAGVEIIDPNKQSEYSWVLERVHALAKQANLKGLPEVGIFESPEPNAFATGPSQSNSLVAVSTGLLNSMSKEEIDAVIGHEIAHIKNGDMVTLTLIQGVLNAFTMFLSRIIAFAISQATRNNDNDEEGGSGISPFFITFFLDIIFGILASLIICWFSRQREFRADAGSAKILGQKEPMISALQKLGTLHGVAEMNSRDSLTALKISSGTGGFLKLFSTHPPLEERIAALQASSIAKENPFR